MCAATSCSLLGERLRLNSIGTTLVSVDLHRDALLHGKPAFVPTALVLRVLFVRGGSSALFSSVILAPVQRYILYQMTGTLGQKIVSQVKLFLHHCDEEEYPHGFM